MHNKIKRRNKMRGGFLDNFISSAKTSLSNFGNTLSNDASTVWDKTKKASNDAYNSVVGTPTPSYSSVGGRYTRKGGCSGYSSLTGIASTASPFSGVTAHPKNWVGGKHKKSKRRQTKRRRKH
jgi:hypothetical protein